MIKLELILIDNGGRSDINTVKSLVHGLLYADSLWDKPEVDFRADGTAVIRDTDADMLILPFQLNSIHDIPTEVAFRIKIVSAEFGVAEALRGNLIFHLKNRLKFTHIRLLYDEVSTYLSNKTYPLINKVENALRKYLVRFFLFEKGLNWWEDVAAPELKEKIKFRKRFDSPFSRLLDQDVNLIDFNELGELIYGKSDESYSLQSILNKLRSLENIKDLKELQQELRGNYENYFKSNFRDYDFERKWKALLDIRNKVAHNSFLTLHDYQTAKSLSDNLLKIIYRAETFFNAEFKLSENIENPDDDSHDALLFNELHLDRNADKLKKLGIKVIGHVDLDKLQSDNKEEHSDLKIITEVEMLREIAEVEEKLENSELRYIGLKAFITKVLAQKGYAISPAYALINHLDENEKIEIYDYQDPHTHYPVKAIRSIEGNFHSNN